MTQRDFSEVNTKPTTLSADEARGLWAEPLDIFVQRSNTPELVGSAALYLGPREFAIFPDLLIRVRTDDRLSPRFLDYFLASDEARQYFRGRAQGIAGTMPKIDQGAVAALPVPWITRELQDRIVAVIESHFSRLDAAVASLERAKANTRRARASILKAAVAGRLVPTEAEVTRATGARFEPASELLRRTPAPPRPNRYKTRSRDVIAGHAALSVGDPESPLPEGWSRTPLVDVARLESGHTPSRAHPEWWGGDVPWISLPDARDHHGRVIRATSERTNEDGLANSAARLLPAGTVCLSRTASVGYVTVMGVPMATSQDFVNWICTSALQPHWLRVVFMADREALFRFAKGSVHRTIYFPELLSMHVAVPPIAEQARIVTEVDRRMSVLDVIDATLDANLARCARLRQAILKRAFEGRLVRESGEDSVEAVAG